MYKTKPYNKTYTVTQMSGNIRAFNDIVTLMTYVMGKPPKYSSYKYGITPAVAIGPNHNPYCTVCSTSILNANDSSKCIKVVNVWCLDTKKFVTHTIEAQHHKHIKSSVIIRDDFGVVMTVDDVVEAYNNCGNVIVSNEYDKYLARTKAYERGETNTRKRMGYDFTHYFRRLRTFNELRQLAAATVDCDHVKVRGRRGKNMVNSWDELYPSIINTAKSWKTQRVKKQWMVNV